MTYQDDFTLPPEIVEQIAEQGLDYLPELIRTLFNTAMQIERQKYLSANHYERCEERVGHANGYKPKTVKTRIGPVTFDIPQVGEVLVYRYRCCRCRRTFRHYPHGVDRARQTARMRALAAIGWLLGMSYRGSSRYLSAFGIALSRMSIWRDVQQRAAQLERERFWKPVRVLGLDGAYVRGWGKTQPVLVAVDMGTGEPVTVGYVDEKDPQAVRRILEPLLQRLGVSVIVTDDLASYKQVAEALQLEQQICQFHVRRWVGLAIHDLKESLPTEWIAVAEQAHQILRDLPIEGDKRLVALSRQFPPSQWGRAGEEWSPVDKLRALIVRLAENWAKFRVFDWQEGVPWTNNPTEQVIGKMKMRARTVRGYKTWSGMASGLMVAGVGLT